MTATAAPAGLEERSAAGLVKDVLRRSGLSQSELARRAGLPRSVLSFYVHGRRRPGAETLQRIAAAGGFDLQLTPRKPPVDAKEAAWKLVQVLELAEVFPFRPRGKLEYPGLPAPSRGR